MPNSSFTINTIQASFNGTTYTGPATVTGTTGGAGSTTTVTLTYQDTTAPTLSCPANITRANDPNQCGAVVNYTAPAANDNCPGIGTVICSPASGAFYPKGVTTVNCSVSDAAGNPASCSFTVTVNDSQVPTITCPANVVQSNDADQCSAVVTYATPTVSDNCPGVGTAQCTPAAGSTFPIGTTNVNCTVRDAANNSANCSFTVTVNDRQAPTLVCPANVTRATDAGQCSAVVAYATPAANDNCPGATVTCTPASGATFAKGTTTVNCTATDAAGNTTSCSFTVTINDQEAPSLSCPGNISTSTDPGVCTATVNYATPAATDNCPGATVSCTPASGTAFSKGTTTVSCTATDSSSNTTSCSFTVTVNDTEPPTASCPADITTATAPGQCSATVSFTATANDNCPGATVACTPASGSVFPKGTTVVSCTATDASNNVSQPCSFRVRVNDQEAPTLVCPAGQVVSTEPNRCSATVTYATPTASDNCPGVGTPQCTPASGSSFPKGTTTVSCSVTDASGNSASCSFTVTVNDTQPPTIACPANLSVPTSAGQCQAIVNYPAPVANDNCPGLSVTCTPASGATFAKGTTTVNCTATDAAGNTSGCSFTVTVVDTERPIITCPSNRTAFQDSAFGATVTYPPPAASDNCPGVTAVCLPPSGSVFPLGVTSVTCTATDTSGNTASCAFTVTVVAPPSTTGAKVTGGGAIAVVGGKGTFGLTAMASSPATPQGNVTYQDHATGMTVKSTVVTAVVVSGNHARIFGKATINNSGAFDFVVDVDEAGEPGSSDKFAIQVSSGYAAGGTLTSGNIQIH